MKIAFRSYGTSSVDGTGGGEFRWVVNMAHFLQTEGHEVHFFPWLEGCDSSFDLALDTPWESCEKFQARKHVHFQFGVSDGALNFPCARTGECNIAAPWPGQYSHWIGGLNIFKFNPILLPIPYPDDLIPQNPVKGFDRTEITWATKGPFLPNFDANHVFTVSGLNMLKSLVRLSKKAEFKMNFIMDNHIRQADPALGVEGLIAQLNTGERRGDTPWTHLLNIMARSKLNVPVGGLVGSQFESAATRGVTVTHPVSGLSLESPMGLPSAAETTEDMMYDALERLWFDEVQYLKSYEYQQECIRQHRDDMFRVYWKAAMEKLELI